MQRPISWGAAMAKVIHEVIAAVDDDSPHDADAWIGLEELLGEEGVDAIWADKQYGPVARFLDEYCHTAQHDRHVVFGKTPMLQARQSLLECKELLIGNAQDFLAPIRDLM